MRLRSTGPARPGRAVFESIKKERRAALRRNAPLLLLMTTALAASAFGVVKGLVIFGHPTHAAFMAGVFTTLWFALIAHLFSVLGTVSRRMGGTAEQWTSTALKRLHGGHLTVLHHLERTGGDTDHVVISSERVLAVETKWTASAMDPAPKGHLKGVRPAWVKQVKDSARWVERQLAECGRPLPVIPVIVLWGPGIGKTATGRFKIGRVEVLIGRQSKTWTPHLEELVGEGTPDPEVVDAVLGATPG